MRPAYLLTIAAALLLSMPTSVVQAAEVARPGTPEWNAIFPPGFNFDPPRSRVAQGRAEKMALPLESFDRLRIRSDGTAATEIDYLSNIVERMLTISTDDVLRAARTPDVRVNYEERLRFFLGPAWTPYELYLNTQKERLKAKLPKSKRMRDLGLRVNAELLPATRHLTFENGRGTFAVEGWLVDGVYGTGTRQNSFLLKLKFITDRASPDIIISEWDLTIRDKQ